MVKAKAVWPIDSYEKGGIIRKQPMSYSVDDPDDPDPQGTLRDFVNDNNPIVVADAVDGFAPYTHIIRAEIKSVEGPVPYDYLADLE